MTMQVQMKQYSLRDKHMNTIAGMGKI